VGNLILAYPNRADASAVSFSGGSWESDLPLINLQNTYLSKVARSTDAVVTNTKFSIDLSTNRYIQILALLKHNISESGKVRIRAFSDAGHTNEIYNSGWKSAWSQVYEPGQVEWEEDEFWTLSWSADTKYPLFHLIVLEEQISARYWEVEFDDTTNGDGYVQCGRLIMASGWQPTRNYSYGAGLAWQSNTLVDRTPGGVADFDERTSQRVQRISLDHLTDDEAFQIMLDIQKELDISGEMFFIADPNDTVNLMRRSFLARLARNDMLTQTYYSGQSANLTLIEVL